MIEKFLLGFALGVYFTWFVKFIVDVTNERIAKKKEGE